MAESHILTERGGVEELIPAWRALVARSDEATVYQTPEWAFGWWRALEKDSTPFCIAQFEQGRLTGFAPLYLKTVLGARVLRFMGAPSHSVNRVLVEPSYAETFASAIANALGDCADRWDVLHIVEREGAPNRITGTVEQTLPALQVRTLSARVNTVVHLPSGWESYRMQFTSRRRKRMNQAARRLGSGGKLNFRVVTDADCLSHELEILFRARLENWRARRRMRRTIVFQRSQVFYDTLTEICTRLAANGQVWLGRLDVDEKPVSWDLGFPVNQNFAEYMKTFDVAYAPHSPGQMLLQEMIHHSIANGIERFEMGAGAQPYKLWYGATPENNQTGVLYWKRPRAYGYIGQEMARTQMFAQVHRFRHGNSVG